MPLNSSIHEVLMEVRKDPNYAPPQKITKEPLEQNKNKYCAYHDGIGHYTEACVSLRLMIEKFIRNGKLVRFLTENHA